MEEVVHFGDRFRLSGFHLFEASLEKWHVRGLGIIILYIRTWHYVLIRFILSILYIGDNEILKLLEKAIINKLYLVFLDNDDRLRKSIKHEGVLLNVLQFFIFLFQKLSIDFESNRKMQYKHSDT